MQQSKFLSVAGLIATMCLLGCDGNLVKSEEETSMSEPVSVKRVRIVCVGDSITDGNTYPLILMQALADAGKPVPAAVCAGVASDTSVLMAERFDPFLDMQPDLVTFSAGTNDAFRNITPEMYEKALREIADKCKARGIEMILMTPCAINVGDTNKPNEKAEATGEEFAKILRAVAKENGWAVAEVSELQKAARDKGETIMSPDGIHPDYHGQSLMARAILDAMGHKNVPVPTAKEFNPQRLPGVIETWYVQAAPKDDKDKPRPMTDEELAEQTTVLNKVISSDLGHEPFGIKHHWTRRTLPEAQKADKDGKFVDAGDWREQLRRNGFAININDLVAGVPRYWGTVVQSPAEAKAFVNTAISVRHVWLNGELVFTHPMNGGEEKWTGYHAGKERVPVTLQQGNNILVVEHYANEFFLSVTDKLVWEDDYAAALEKAAKK